MQCPKCGMPLNSNDEPCANCQQQTNANDSNLGNPQVLPKRHMPKWFKIAVFLTLMALIAVSAGLLFTETLIDVPQKQLNLLRKNEIVEAYNKYSSKQFKSKTSLEEFSAFIEKYPIFIHNHSALFPQRSISDHITILRGKLISAEQTTTPIEYRLIKEDGKWKVLSVSVLKNHSQNKSEQKKVIQLTKSLLKNIQKNQIDLSYNRDFTDEFKAATSLDEFKNFIKENALLIQAYKASFYNPIIKDNKASVAIVLKSDQPDQTEQKTIYLKNYYIKINDEWKILNINLLTPTQMSQE